MSWTSTRRDIISKRELTPEERECVEDVLDAAASWAAGELPYYEAANIGALEWGGKRSAGYTRNIALKCTAKTDPRWRNLYDLITELIGRSGWVVSNQGCFAPSHLHGDDLWAA